MKLRIQGDALRLRVSPSEMKRLVCDGRLAETIHFGAGDTATLTYALEHNADEPAIRMRYEGGEITVLLPSKAMRAWADGDDVGLYTTFATGAEAVELAIEKDFACLDKSDEQNEDTFPNPHQGAVC